MVALHAPLFNHHFDLLHTAGHRQRKLHRRTSPNRTKWALLGGIARVKLQLQRDRVADAARIGVGKRLRSQRERGFAVHKGELECLRATKAQIHIALFSRCQNALGVESKTAGLAPGRIANAQVMGTVQLDVEVIGIAAVLKGKFVLRGPVVHGAAQKKHGIAQRGRNGAAFCLQCLGYALGIHAQCDAVVAVKRRRHFRSLWAQLPLFCALPKIGIRRPRLITHFETVFALQARHQLVAIASPGKALCLVRRPAVEAAAQIKRPAL